MKTDFSQTVFILHFDEKGFPFVTTDTLENRVRESAEETTSPRGVEPKLFVDGTDLKYWMPNGRARLVDTYETEEEAHQEWLERTYEYDYLNHDGFNDDYDTMDDLLQNAADIMEIDVEVVKSIMHHHELYRQGESKRRAERMMALLEKAKKDANGQLTKKLEKAVDACRSNGYMYGTYDRWGGNAELDTQKYYTEEFRQDLERLYNGFIHKGRIAFLYKELDKMGAMVLADGNAHFLIGEDIAKRITAEVEANGESYVKGDERTKMLEQMGMTEKECWQMIRTGNTVFALLTPEGTRKYRK